MRVDMWYQGETIARASCFFYPNEGEYRGNFYNEDGRAVGDFWGTDSAEIEKRLKEILQQDRGPAR